MMNPNTRLEVDMESLPPPEILFDEESLKKLKIIATHASSTPEEVLTALIYWTYLLKTDRWLQIVRTYRDFHRP
jgi:hypothetical protein